MKIESLTNQTPIKALCNVLCDWNIDINKQERRIENLNEAIKNGAQYVVCVSDERTGVRFKKRHPDAIKIGHTSYCYQLWACTEYPGKKLGSKTIRDMFAQTTENNMRNI